MESDDDNFDNEWNRINHLPQDDDFDEDDELDARIAKAERKKRLSVNRNGFRGV